MPPNVLGCCITTASTVVSFLPTVQASVVFMLCSMSFCSPPKAPFFGSATLLGKDRSIASLVVLKALSINGTHWTLVHQPVVFQGISTVNVVEGIIALMQCSGNRMGTRKLILLELATGTF